MRKRGGVDGEEEVDLLLRAAEDELLLNLSVNSHTSRGGDQYIEPDLDRRFQSLKSSRPTSVTNKAAAKRQPPTQAKAAPTVDDDDEKKRAVDGSNIVRGDDDDDDDLFARFAALKSSLPCSSSFQPNRGDHQPNPQTIATDGVNGNDESDEVQKLIQWAIDAARLDPSPPSDSDAENDDDGDEDEDDDDDDDDDDSDHGNRKNHQKKGKRKEGKKT